MSLLGPCIRGCSHAKEGNSEEECQPPGRFEFLQRVATHINDSPSCDILLPALLQVRQRCLERIQNTVKSEVKVDRNLGCRWCLNSWSLGQYTVRVLPQKRPKGFRGLRSKSADPGQAKRFHKFIGHNFMSLKCDVCRGITKIPALKPIETPKEESKPPTPPVKNKKKKSKKRDDFAGLNPAAVKSAKVSKSPLEPCDSGKQVLNVFEVLSPSSIQNGVNIFSNRTSKNRPQSSVSAQEKSSIIKPVSDSPSFKLSSLSKSKKKKVKNGLVEKPKKTKTVKSALASFLNSL
ncbi:hypothetical protein GE061_009950 [Apolygus lucorum]|uniref:Uncharacterized protein n=1 Tax=Apolygus lucorum TaxID=248454 RepID=A0A8S9Y3Q5_APOLU|nr:hypothetical protein GE061_009950 [Apolygus lucorum]